MMTTARKRMLSVAAVTVAMVGLGAGLATRSDGGATRRITSDAAPAQSTTMVETTTAAPDEGRSADTEPPAVAPKPTTTTAVTGPTTTDAPRPPAPAGSSQPATVDSDSRLRVDGLGPVRIGMGLKEARAASGLPMAYRESAACASFQTDGPPAGLSFTGVDGSDRLDLIIVSEPSIATVSGIKVGSTLAEARRAYGDKLRGSLEDGWGKLVFRPGDASLDHLALGLLFSEGRVAGMWAGLRVVVEADEICA